jgi:tetratricopeptide (TPR) repeat protein
MPSGRHEKPEKPDLQAPVRAGVADPTIVLRQIAPGESLEADYLRLLVALRDAAPGEIFFVQINSPIQRRQLPEQLMADGLQRSFAVVDFATFQPGPPPHGILRQFLEDLQSTQPEILFVDGLEHWIDADPKTIEALNLGRERLASLGVVIVFLLPAYLIDLIRARALNLWTWRAHYYSLDPIEDVTKPESTMSLDTGRPVAPGDTPESRDRRIRILQRLLNEGLAEHRTLDSLVNPVLLPLTRELYDAGRFTEALSVLDQVKEHLEKAEDSLDKASILNLRALVLQALGNFNEAERCLSWSLAVREKMLTSDHLDVAQSLNNLAGLYYSQGKYAEAEPLYQRALAIYEQVLGPAHPAVATSLNNLAGLYDNQGKYADAEPFYQKALTILKKSLGPEHPNFTTCLENYAALLRKTSRETEATELEARAQAIRVKRAQRNPVK